MKLSTDERDVYADSHNSAIAPQTKTQVSLTDDYAN
jgi:hypothetical protein